MRGKFRKETHLAVSYWYSLNFPNYLFHLGKNYRDQNEGIKWMKTSYISPATGELDINVVRDYNPRVIINLDLGIPNFTIFSLQFPLVVDEPKNMTVVTQEALGVLLDEVATFMISMKFDQKVITDIYARVLSCFAGMNMDSSTQANLDETLQDSTMQTYRGTFKIPIDFVQETQKRIVTGASFVQRMPKVRSIEFAKAPPVNKYDINDARRTIQMYKNRQLKTQPKPLYIIVYDQMGRQTGVLPVDQQWKSKLLKKIQAKQAAKEEIPITPEILEQLTELRGSLLERIKIRIKQTLPALWDDYLAMKEQPNKIISQIQPGVYPIKGGNLLERSWWVREKGKPAVRPLPRKAEAWAGDAYDNHGGLYEIIKDYMVRLDDIFNHVTIVEGWPLKSRKAAPKIGPIKPPVSSYSDDDVRKASLMAGLKLYGLPNLPESKSVVAQYAKQYGINLKQFKNRGGTGLIWGPKVQRGTITKLYGISQENVDPEELSWTVGTFSYVFYPSKSTGLDAADDKCVFDPELQDVDGNVYIHSADDDNVSLVMSLPSNADQLFRWYSKII